MAEPLRRQIVLGVIGVLILGAAAVVLTHLQDFALPPWENQRAFHFPSGAVLDKEGALVVADHGGRRLTRVDTSGNRIWQREGGQRDGGFYVATPLAPDVRGGVWVVNAVQSQRSGSAERLELLDIAADGTIGKPVWQRTNTTEEQAEYNRVPYFWRLDGEAFHYFIADAEGNTFFHEVVLATGKDSVIREFPQFDAYEDIGAAYDPNSAQGWFLDNAGHIQKWGANDQQEPREMYDNPVVGGKKIRVPSDLRVAMDGSLLVLDGKGEILKIDDKGKAVRWLTPAQVGRPLYITAFAPGADGRLALADEAAHSALVWDPRKPQALESIAGAKLTAWQSFGSWLVWGCAVAGVVLLLALLVLVYVRVMRRRTPLLFKQLGIFLPLIIGSVLVIALWIYQDMMGRYIAEVEQRQITWSQVGAQMVDAATIDALDFAHRPQSEIVDSPDFAKLTTALTRIVNANADAWNATIFDYLYVPAGQDWFVFDQFTYFERYLPKPAMLDVAHTGKPAAVRYEDAYSSWLSGFSPIKRADGSVAALLEVTTDQNVFSEITANFGIGLAWALGAVLVVLVVLAFFSTYWLLLSIRSLKQSASLISEGQYDVQVDIRSRDEIEDLGRMFNRMSREIKSYVDRVVLLNQANAKFVPSQFLHFLGKQNITEIRLGDHIDQEMTVLFSDIRSFTTLSERMTPEENFNFINRYLMEMGPVIRTQEGFIDKYIGDAIMALFPRQAQDGLKAALAMFDGLDRFNKSAGQGRTAEAIHIGIGLHTGRLMLGIIGEAERFDGTVISDAVNLASRLESLTKYYGAAILVSGQTLDLIPDKRFFQSRLLDRVQVKGKSEAVELHEILVPGHAYSAEKLAVGDDFQKALKAYFAGDFEQAQVQFFRLSQTCPNDLAIPIYLKRMQAFLNSHKPGSPWTGVTTLDSK